MSKKSTALARIRQLSGLGLPSGLFVSSLLPVLRSLTESDSAAFFWLDDAGGIANFYADRFPALETFPPAADAQIFLSEGAGWSASPQPPSVEAVLTSTAEAERASNTLYGEVLRRNGACYILHGLATRERSAAGRVSLFRSAAGRPYGAREVAALSSVMRYVSHGLATAEAADAGETEEVLEQELLVADRGGQVLHATESGRRLLLLSTGCPLGPRTLGLAKSVSQQLLQCLCASGASSALPAPSPAPTMTRNTLWGRFALRAYWLNDEMVSEHAPVGVHIVRSQPACLRFVKAMSTLPLSPQQREIALMIARGASNRDIAAHLSVSINTVAYHIKQLFYKLRAHDRAELISRINATIEPAPGPEWAGSSAGPDTASAAFAVRPRPAARARARSRGAGGR